MSSKQVLLCSAGSSNPRTCNFTKQVTILRNTCKSINISSANVSSQNRYGQPVAYLATDKQRNAADQHRVREGHIHGHCDTQPSLEISIVSSSPECSKYHVLLHALLNSQAKVLLSAAQSHCQTNFNISTAHFIQWHSFKYLLGQVTLNFNLSAPKSVRCMRDNI